MKTWFITGGTPGGFGMSFAEAALAVGDRVVLTARQTGALRAWEQAHQERALVLPLDVTDAGQLDQAVGAAESRFGSIDVLVNNAGRGWFGSVEGTPEEAIRRQFELNFFAALAVTRRVLPGMRARRSGWIVSISSAAGLRPSAGFGYYSAAKAALESITEVLRTEVAPFGIQVLAVEPGAFRTAAYAGFADEPVREPVAEYRALVESVRSAMVAQDGHQPGDPDRGARAVVQAMDRHRPPQRLVLGNAAFDGVVAALEGALADIRSSEELARGADFPDGS